MMLSNGFEEEPDFSNFFYEDQDDPFVLHIMDCPSASSPNKPLVVEADCPYASQNEAAQIIQPHDSSHWYDYVNRREVHENPPRCLLFRLPKNPFNLNLSGLKWWSQEAKRYLPRETICGLFIEDAQLPCGHHPLCQRNCYRQSMESQRFIHEQIMHESSLFIGLEKQFPGVDKQTIKLLRDYAGEPNRQNESYPLPITELARVYETYPKKIYRILNICEAINPKTFATLKAYRERHLKETKAYEVGKYQR